MRANMDANNLRKSWLLMSALLIWGKCSLIDAVFGPSQQEAEATKVMAAQMTEYSRQQFTAESELATIDSNETEMSAGETGSPIAYYEDQGTEPPSSTQETSAPSGQEEQIFMVGSDLAVYNGASAPTTFTIDESWLLTVITTYHWNDAAGAAPGTIELRAADGTTYGPWQASGAEGQGGVPDAYWIAYPNIVLPPGTYTVTDSDPNTWAQNEETGGAGMAWASGIRQGNP